MKKFYCYLGLFFGGIIINLLFGYLFLLFTFITFPISFLLDIIILIFVSSKLVSIIKLFKQNLNIGTPTFIILTQLTIAILSTVSFLYVKFSRYSLCIWSDPIFDYEIEYLFPLATSISSTIILYLTVIISLIIYFKEKYQKRKSKQELDIVWKSFLPAWVFY